MSSVLSVAKKLSAAALSKQVPGRPTLERLLEPEYTGLQLITQTRAIDEAEDWLKLVPGLEGVVAKRYDRPYLAGERQWIKVKKQRTADCAVIGIAGDSSRPSLVLELRHADGLFHHFGVARSSNQMLTEVLSTVL